MDTFVRIYDFIERTFWFTLSRKLSSLLGLSDFLCLRLLD